MPEIPRRKRGQATDERRNCRYCGKEANAKGIASHERACKKKKDDLEKTLAFLASRRQEVRDEDLDDALQQTRRTLNTMNLDGNAADNDNDNEHDNDMLTIPGDAIDYAQHVGSSSSNPATASTLSAPDQQAAPVISPPVDPVTGQLIDDAIKIVYHPNSERAEEVKSLFEYRNQTRVTPPVEKKPWKPFETRGDYEFAEISLAASLSVQQNNALISLIHQFIRGEAHFTIKSNTELQEKWKQASLKVADFKTENFDVKYKRETRSFKIYYCPIWDWILDLLSDPQIVSKFTWNARKLYKYQASTNTYVRFYNEPWTADRFWDVQSEFQDKKTKPFCIIFYADKNKLSSFGTQKGYPVVVRCANLPVEMRNGDGIGGGRIVGWLPVVSETAEDTGKTSFANFKTAVWHRAVDVILRTIEHISKTGRWVKCGDGVTRHICPLILIISADHEEQWVIAANRGIKGYKACTVCNHPTKKLSDLLVTHTLRTAEDSEAYYTLTKSFSTHKSKEFILKLHGMRPVKSAFWSIGHTDVHRALSWDRLHAYHSGLFAAHIWRVFKKYFEDMGRSVEAKVDDRLNLFPRWKNLYHFQSAVNVTFNDGSKHEDLSKQLIYVIHDIFERKDGSAGYLFVRLFRKYLELDILMSFDLQTEETISCAETELKNFGKLLLEYKLLTARDPKNWNFLKAHSHKHACDDIRAKGVTRNYNTKPNEKLHGPLRDIYHECTNFRNVAPQILKVSHNNLVSTYIRSQLDLIDSKTKEDGLDFDSAKPGRQPLLPPNDKFTLGAPQKACSLSQAEEFNKDDIAFRDFRKKLIVNINNHFRVFNIPFPDNKYMRLAAQHEITEFRYMKLNYDSLVTWGVLTDYLRCSPDFFGKPRYDCIIFNVGPKICFARLVFVFAIWIDGTAHPFALVQAFDANNGPPKDKDVELGLRRIRLKARSAVEFIPVGSIIRGAVVVPVFEEGNENDYFVMDLIDADMFMRCKSLGSFA